MTIREIVRQGFYYTRTYPSLWLFGFLVGIAGGGSSGGGNSGGGGGGLTFLNLSGPQLALLLAGIIVSVAVMMVLRFIGEGALIEGVVRARQGRAMTMSEGFRAGWTHWGVLVRIALLYLAVMMGSVAVFVVPCVLALWTFGPIVGALCAIVALFIAVPWLVTLYLVQAFAWRIAVLENRRALDAIAKARLFLHGRLIHGLKLIVASLVGTLAIALLGLLAIVPVGLLLVALAQVVHIIIVIALAFVVLVPVICVLTAIVGTLRSSIWTIGYVTQAES